MKKFLIILCAIFTLTSAYASDQQLDRLYVEPGSIYVAPNGIFLIIEGELYGVTSIEVDESGVYVPVPNAGFCGKHGYYPGNSPVCPKCQKEKGK